MNRLCFFVTTALLTLILQSCGGYAPLKVNLAPKINVATSNEGKNIAIGIRVVDERPSKSLGRLTSAYGSAAEITSTEDLDKVIKAQLIDALQKKGFNPVEFSATKEPRLTIEIRLLEYSTSNGIGSDGVYVKGALKASAIRASDNYEHLYRSENLEHVIWAPMATAEFNEKLINSALTELLNQVFIDKELFKFLAG